MSSQPCFRLQLTSCLPTSIVSSWEKPACSASPPQLVSAQLSSLWNGILSSHPPGHAPSSSLQEPLQDACQSLVNRSSSPFPFHTLTHLCLCSRSSFHLDCLLQPSSPLAQVLHIFQSNLITAAGSTHSLLWALLRPFFYVVLLKCTFISPRLHLTWGQGSYLMHLCVTCRGLMQRGYSANSCSVFILWPQASFSTTRTSCINSSQRSLSSWITCCPVGRNWVPRNSPWRTAYPQIEPQLILWKQAEVNDF